MVRPLIVFCSLFNNLAPQVAGDVRDVEPAIVVLCYAKVIAYLYDTQEADERADFALRFIETFCESFL